MLLGIVTDWEPSERTSVSSPKKGRSNIAYVCQRNFCLVWLRRSHFFFSVFDDF